MTTPANINTRATAINRTTAHLVNKIKFFINADNVKANYNLKNIVGFTDTRENLRPFHIIKYIGDNYLDDFDNFFLIQDDVYIDARKLKKVLTQISITFDLYMGTRSVKNQSSDLLDFYKKSKKSNNGNGSGNVRIPSDRNYCELEAGILFSSSVIRKMRNNLDWCVRNGVTNTHSVNIGRCVKYSSNISGCQERFQVS